MPDSPNKLSQFWQELKRRKVTRTITVYAAAAFVTLELVSIIVEPLKLPEWFLLMVIVLLCAGFIITVIVSWIYDIQPEGGIVKTEPANKVKAEHRTVTSNSWRIASYISFVVIVALIVLNVLPRIGLSRGKALLEKSIAVLPFINDSSDEENTYFINGTMESVLDNLCKIKDLRVISRSSVEQYRNNLKPAPEIAKEMNVSYVLEGSGQKLGNRIVLTIQLIDGNKDHHLWSKQYDRKIQKVEDLIDIQSEVAQLVAAEIEAIITREEKQLIEKTPTTSLTAYEFYQKGEEELSKYWRYNSDKAALEKAEDLFQYALEYDSSFALAYIGLADVYWEQHYDSEYLEEGYLDSVLRLANLALFHDSTLVSAYIVKGYYYYTRGNPEKAIIEYERALKYNPNDADAHTALGSTYQWNLGNYKMAIISFHEAEMRSRGNEHAYILSTLGRAYLDAGFIDKARTYYRKALELDGDSLNYLYRLSWLEFSSEDFNAADTHSKEALNKDPNRLINFPNMVMYSSFADNHEDAYKFAEEYKNNWLPGDPVPLKNFLRLGYAFWKAGKYEESDYYLKKQITYCLEAIELGRQMSNDRATYYILAAVYALLGEKSEAYHYLNEFSKTQCYPLWRVALIKNDPLFESFRVEPEFQQIEKDVEAKHQAEHERVRQWLEENDML